MELATPSAPMIVDALAGNTKRLIFTCTMQLIIQNICNRGPGWKVSTLESNRIIGRNQALKALELHQSPLSAISVTGKIDYVQRYWDITKAIITDSNGDHAELCYPAMVSVIHVSILSRSLTMSIIGLCIR
jgi:hypothetical protein